MVPRPVQCQDTLSTLGHEQVAAPLAMAALRPEASPQLWQLNGGMGFIGRGIVLDGSLQLGLHQNAFLALGFEGAWRTSKDKPSDYDGGLFTLLTWGAEHLESSGTFHFTWGIQQLGANRAGAFSFQVGPSLGACTRVEYSRNSGSGGWAPNYNVEEKHYSMVPGLTLKANGAWIISDAFGLDIGLVGNLNKRYSYAGLKFGMNIGQLR